VRAVSRRWWIVHGRVGPGYFPPEVALHLVRRACELPEQAGRSLSQWDCAELARQLVRDEVVASISPQTVQRMLAADRLKPWRSHVWLHPRTPRDATFAEQVRAVAALLTRLLDAHEVVLSLDEMTSLQPRPRRVATRPAQPGRPVQVEHEYRRAGATHLVAAFDTRSGQVYGVTTRRKRQVEYLTLLEHLDRAIPVSVTTIHLLADNVSVHHGKLVQQWLATHPRFVAHFTPVHCSWMNPVEQWFGILRRKRLRAPNFADLAALQRAIHQFIAEWNAIAHPFRWTARSFDKILATVEATLAAETASLANAA
jgi:transposase